MGNITYERGACTAPFLDLSKFPGSDGYLPGRFCAPVPTAQGSINCCLPCPLQDWVYSDRFRNVPEVVDWLNVAGLICAGLLLVSYFVLPVEKTSRHYLTVGMVVGVMVLQLGFIVPLATKPQQCHDSITPNSMYSDLSCAFSGAFVLLGGFAAIMWCFLRSLSLHLQVCWNVVPGRKFFWGSVLAGCGIPMVFAAISFAVTGVSTRFGTTCLLNHKDALQDYWGPLLAFAAVSMILQFATFGYCIKVYIRSLFDDSTTSDNSSALPSYNSSVRTVTAKQAYRRVQKVIALQWRGILIVLINIANVAFMSILFVSMDNSIQAAKKDTHKAEPWLICLVVNHGDKNTCLGKVGGLVKSESSMMAALILLSLNGFWTWILLGRFAIVSGWIAFVHSKFTHSHDFVSVDARRFSADPRNYEMIISPPQTALKSADAHQMTSPGADKDSVSLFSQSTKFDRMSKSDYFGKETMYASPTLSFSTPRPPSAGLSQHGREWDPASTHAKSSQPNTFGNAL